MDGGQQGSHTGTHTGTCRHTLYVVQQGSIVQVVQGTCRHRSSVTSRQVVYGTICVCSSVMYLHRRHRTTSLRSSGTNLQVVYGMYWTFCSGTMMQRWQLTIRQ